MAIKALIRDTGSLELSSSSFLSARKSMLSEGDQFYSAMAWHNYEHYAAWYFLGNNIYDHDNNNNSCYDSDYLTSDQAVNFIKKNQ